MRHAYYTQMLNIMDGISREIKENGGVWCEVKGKKKQKDEDSENSDTKQRV